MMKRLIPLSLLIINALALSVSCEKDETASNQRLCDREYFYYASNSRIYLKQSKSEIWIVFKDDQATKDVAQTILSKYSFIDMSVTANNYNQIKVTLNKDVTNCTAVNNYLEILNEDDDILSATPIFYSSVNDPDSYYILLSEVLTKNDENVISEADLIDYAETVNLELIEATYSSQRFQVKEVKTGFEALEISNQIYESGKVKYAHPNCIVKIQLN